MPRATALLIRRPNTKVQETPGKSQGSRSRAQALFDLWVRQYAEELYRFAYRLCGNPEIAEDLLQETFYEAWKSMAKLREQDKARAWLFQILRHRYSRWCRTEARAPAHIPIESVPLDALIATSQVIPGAKNKDEFQGMLDRISDRCKIPLLMVFMEGLTCQESADRLDLPLGTVLSRIHRAKRQLRALLDDEAIAREGHPSEVNAPNYRVGGAS